MFPNAKLVIIPTKKKCKSSIPLFRFHLDRIECQKWIKAIPRKNLKVSDSCRICAKHFVKSDIQTITTNSRKIKNSGNDLIELKRV